VLRPLLSAAGAVWSRLPLPRRLELPEHELRLPNWPQRLDGLRVALVSDLHAGGPNVPARRLERIVAQVNATRPDLIALCGDYVDPDVPGGGRVEPEVVAEQLARLEAPAGVIAVLGNHDWLHEGHAMADALIRAGIVTLENGAVPVQARGGPLWVAGVADAVERDPRAGAALADVPGGAPVLLLSHNPDVFPYVPARVALTLSGHTHGAQVDLPFLARHVVPSRFGERYKAGHVVEHGRHLFVSRGVGETGIPIRLLAAPEVPVLVLRPEG
jgi:hypothetical protein